MSEIKPSVLDIFWNADDCAEVLKIKGGGKSFMQYTAILPTFPKPMQVETARTLKRKNLLWKPSDVIEWVEKRRS